MPTLLLSGCMRCAWYASHSLCTCRCHSRNGVINPATSTPIHWTDTAYSGDLAMPLGALMPPDSPGSTASVTQPASSGARMLSPDAAAAAAAGGQPVSPSGSSGVPTSPPLPTPPPWSRLGPQTEAGGSRGLGPLRTASVPGLPSLPGSPTAGRLQTLAEDSAMSVGLPISDSLLPDQLPSVDSLSRSSSECQPSVLARVLGGIASPAQLHQARFSLAAVAAAVVAVVAGCAVLRLQAAPGPTAGAAQPSGGLLGSPRLLQDVLVVVVVCCAVLAAVAALQRAASVPLPAPGWRPGLKLVDRLLLFGLHIAQAETLEGAVAAVQDVLQVRPRRWPLQPAVPGRGPPSQLTVLSAPALLSSCRQSVEPASSEVSQGPPICCAGPSGGAGPLHCGPPQVGVPEAGRLQLHIRQHGQPHADSCTLPAPQPLTCWQGQRCKLLGPDQGEQQPVCVQAALAWSDGLLLCRMVNKRHLQGLNDGVQG